MTTEKPVDARSASANYAHRHRALGLCQSCPEPAGINPRTGKYYTYCHACRKVVAAAKKLLMRERRRQGIA